ncbi:adenylate/guanylate cyclase domain-containing protein [Mycobacterium sp. MS1601]|uniref:adenylate/guanylate cyclase domain-containing protein n=1 Tax=Mycobacterium sp. MS1601 TaxID=1936029 RepID=UPI000979328A|nr:adenylate/guanylate cyclase domain-containing protein [Mycobacterium sp. MS1601]AQA04178.1 adenylate/guanylate cyclase domain-containing protein [Mycobacterium sp. MS1601]
MADEREELIDWLLDRGITAEQIRNSFSPMLLAPRRVIGDDGTYVSTRQVSHDTGMDVELVQRVLRAAGLPRVDNVDAKVFLKADANIAAVLQKCVELGIDPENLVQVSRTLADGLATAAEVMRFTGLATVLQPGATELQIAQRLEDLVVQVEPLLGELVWEMLLLQLRHSMETEAVSASERAAGAPLPGAREIAVAFADLVGFTRLGEAVEPEQLERLANHLADMAREVAVPPVRLVKTIGDAVMLVCPDPALLLDAMLQLCGAAQADNNFPRLRVGLAFGEAVSRAGDWFGAPVNLASRVTGAARPGAVLVAEAARDAIGDAGGYQWSFAGAKKLKGVKGEVKLFRARRCDDIA